MATRSLTPTQPPPSAERVQALDFETTIREQGEAQARLRHLLRAARGQS